MGDLLVEATGWDGTITLYEDRLEIRRDGLVATLFHLTEGTKSVPLDHVSTIDTDWPGRVPTGYVEIVTSGREGTESWLTLDNGGYSVTITDEDEAEFRELVERFYELRQTGSADGPTVP